MDVSETENEPSEDENMKGKNESMEDENEIMGDEIVVSAPLPPLSPPLDDGLLKSNQEISIHQTTSSICDHKDDAANDDALSEILRHLEKLLDYQSAVREEQNRQAKMLSSLDNKVNLLSSIILEKLQPAKSVTVLPEEQDNLLFRADTGQNASKESLSATKMDNQVFYCEPNVPSEPVESTLSVTPPRKPASFLTPLRQHCEQSLELDRRSEVTSTLPSPGLISIRDDSEQFPLFLQEPNDASRSNLQSPLMVLPNIQQAPRQTYLCNQQQNQAFSRYQQQSPNPESHYNKQSPVNWVHPSYQQQQNDKDVTMSPNDSFVSEYTNDITYFHGRRCDRKDLDAEAQARLSQNMKLFTLKMIDNVYSPEEQAISRVRGESRGGEITKTLSPRRFGKIQRYCKKYFPREFQETSTNEGQSRLLRDSINLHCRKKKYALKKKINTGNLEPVH